VNVSITLSFPSASAAMAALAHLNSISDADRPDVGAEVPLALAPVPAAVLAQPDPATVFGKPDPAAVFGAAIVEPLQAPAPVQIAPNAYAGPAVVFPVVPSEPAAPAAEAAAAPSGPTQDSTGLPWDARIHAATKTTNKDGSWRTLRGVEETFKTTVEQQLRAAMGTPAPAPPTPPAAATAPVVSSAPAPAPASVVSPATTGPETFAQFMARVAPTFTADPGGSTTKMGQALMTVGLSAVGQLAARPDLIAPVALTFDALCASPA